MVASVAASPLHPHLVETWPQGLVLLAALLVPKARHPLQSALASAHRKPRQKRPTWDRAPPVYFMARKCNCRRQTHHLHGRNVIPIDRQTNESLVQEGWARGSPVTWPTEIADAYRGSGFMPNRHICGKDLWQDEWSQLPRSNAGGAV